MLEFEGFDIDLAGGERAEAATGAVLCPPKGVQCRRLGNLRHRGRTGEAAGGVLGEGVVPVMLMPPTHISGLSARGTTAGLAWEPPSPSSWSFPVVVELRGDGWRWPVKRGRHLVVPWGAGTTKAVGHVELLRCLPPLPADAKIDDPTAN